jgi:ABC-type Zn uptake system ZnuABC Zn-binding protein ZnuA
MSTFLKQMKWSKLADNEPTSTRSNESNFERSIQELETLNFDVKQMLQQTSQEPNNSPSNKQVFSRIAARKRGSSLSINT